jgi:gas vesicle protein
MTDFVCTFCNSSFSSKSNLALHQQRAKKCLKLRNKELPADFSCEKCGKLFTSKYNLADHTEKCDGNMMQMYKDLEHRYQTVVSSFTEKITEMKVKLEMKDEQLRNKDTELEKKDKQIAELQKQLGTIAEIGAKKNTTVNNSVRYTNVVTNLVPYTLDDETINRVVDEKFDEKYLRDKSKGVAKFAAIHLLQGENGTMKMKCTDISRKKFIRIDHNNNVHVDMNASTLLNPLLPAVRLKSAEIIKDKVDDDLHILTYCMFDITEGNVVSRLCEILS